MSNLSIDQLISLASNAGFSGPDLGTAVAIALAESSGNPQAYNPEVAAGAAEGQGSYGLWQIYLTAHPQFSAASLVEPGYNAQAAYAIYQQAGYSFQPWTTYKSGAYLNYLDQVNQAIAGASAGGNVVDSNTGGNGSPASYWPVLALALGGGALIWLWLRG